MLTYVLQVVLFQVLFILVYDIALSKETFFSKNRLYLLSTTVASFLIPLFKIETLNKVVSQEYTVLLPEIVLSPQKVIEKTSWYQSINYVEVLFALGMMLFATIFLIRLFKLIRLIHNHKKSSYESYTLVLLPKNAKAFSFFNYIFIGEELTGEKKNNVIKHELVHCKQKHTLDLLLFEILKIVMWFNPMIWIFQKRISLVHEFISDEVVSKSSEKNNYINNLLSEIFQVENISFVNQFYKKSLIRKRITMITKNRSKQIKNLKYLLLVPVVVSMLFYTSCTDNENINKTSIVTLDNQKIYLTTLDNKLETSDTKKSYMDLLLGVEAPTSKEYSLNDLTIEERKEYKETISSAIEEKSTFSRIKPRIFQGNNNRKVLFYNFNNAKEKNNTSETTNSSVLFSKLDVAPTFPGCETGDKKCFNKSLLDFVTQNFDTSITNNLGLKKGKTRIFSQFKITKEGEISEIKTRAPHKTIENYTNKIIKQLPKMKPGVKNKKPVSVLFTLPITFEIK